MSLANFSYLKPRKDDSRLLVLLYDQILKSLLDIKAVLVVGILYQAESVNWKMILGDSSDSAMNTPFFTAGTDPSVDWAKEILVNSRGRYMDII